MARRPTIGVALVAALGWTCLLFGIGLDDLTDGDSKPGVVFAVVVVSILAALLLAAIMRLVRPYVERRLGRDQPGGNARQIS